jgi:hypothetical protein
MREKENVTRLINAAATEVLRPMGFRQKGRSRMWIADHDWWLAVVEFQSSGFSQGSYLNVGCTWLWNERATLAFDLVDRVEGFRRFEIERRFAEATDRLTAKAAEKIADYRSLFPTIVHVSEHYARNALDGFWPCFNAAVAHFLSGRLELGAYVLSKCLESTANDAPWLAEARLVARTLASTMQEPHRFRQCIADRVHSMRRMQRLPQLHQVDFGSDHVAVE